jgi:hypothetical protein
VNFKRFQKSCNAQRFHCRWFINTYNCRVVRWSPKPIYTVRLFVASIRAQFVQILRPLLHYLPPRG